MSQRGHREMRLEALYTGYRKNVMATDEVLAWIKVPKPGKQEFMRAYKVSKRWEDDISAVCLAIQLQLHDGRVRQASIGVGGVAATPVRAQKNPDCLAGPRLERRHRATRHAGAALRVQPHQRYARLGQLPQRSAGQLAATLLAGKPGPQRGFAGQPASNPARRGSMSKPGPSKTTASNAACAVSPAQATRQPSNSAASERAAPDRAAPKTACGQSLPHESAKAQVAGAAHYIDDLPEVRGTLHAAPILSPLAHGRLKAVDASAVRKLPGVVDVVLAADIPGDPMLAAFAGDEPVFARDTVQFVGQVVGLVIANTAMQARRAARQVQLDIEALPAILSVQQAMQAQSYVLPPRACAPG